MSDPKLNHKHSFYGDPDVIDRAKQEARQRGHSVSRAVTRLLELWTLGVFGNLFAYYDEKTINLWQAARLKARSKIKALRDYLN